jgi:hypothetical protein
MMRAPAALPFFAVLFCVCCTAESMSTEPGSLDIKHMVDNVDSHLKALNRANATLQTGTDRGGELTIYRRGSEVVRIDATIGGSNSDLQDVFYYSDANLVFVRSKIITYPYSSTLNGFDFRKPHVKAAADYYVRNRKLIPIAHAKTAPPVASRLLQEGELFLTVARRESRTVDIEKLLK